MKLPYFKLGEAFNELKLDLQIGSASDKVGSIAKLAGKTATNVGLLAVDMGVHVAKNIPVMVGRQAAEALKNNPDLPPERRAELKAAVQRGKETWERLWEEKRHEAELDEVEKAEKATWPARRAEQRAQREADERYEREREAKALAEAAKKAANNVNRTER